MLLHPGTDPGDQRAISQWDHERIDFSHSKKLASNRAGALGDRRILPVLNEDAIGRYLSFSSCPLFRRLEISAEDGYLGPERLHALDLDRIHTRRNKHLYRDAATASRVRSRLSEVSCRRAHNL